MNIIRTSQNPFPQSLYNPDLPETGRRVLHYLNHAGEYGRTWKELARDLGVHHGTASGALSALHKVKQIVRLEDKRGGCSIYVLPQYINGRKYVQYRSNAAKRALLDLIAQLEIDLDNGDIDACRRHMQEVKIKYDD